MNYKIITPTAYFIVATILAGYFAQIVTKAKETSAINRFHPIFFKVISNINVAVMLASFLGWALHERNVIDILPDGGRLVCNLSILLTFPLGSFCRYFNLYHQSSKATSEEISP